MLTSIDVVPRSSRLAVQFSVTSFFHIANFFQIWSTVAGYDIVCGILSNKNWRSILNEWIIDFIHDTRRHCTRFRIDGIKAMSRSISGGKKW